MFNEGVHQGSTKRKSVNWIGLGKGLFDFTLSLGEATVGTFAMITSPILGPGAPLSFAGGLVAAGHGALGMVNSGLAIQDALYGTDNPGFLEYVGDSLGGESGAKLGKAGDLFLGIRPAAIASGGMESAKDVYEVFDGLDAMNSEFSR